MIARGTLVLVLVLLLAATSPAVADEPVPSVVTRAFIRDLAEGRRAMRDVIDPAAGVVVLDHFTGAAGGPGGPSERLACGAALTRQLRRVKGWLYAAVHTDDVDEGGLSCRNRPSPVCTIGGTMEYDPVLRLHFRVDDDRGVVLHAITIDDEVLVDAREIAADHRAHARRIPRLAAAGCPG